MRRGRGGFRTLLLCLVLEVGALAGIPMRPDEIERLMRILSKGSAGETLPDEKKTSDE